MVPTGPNGETGLALGHRREGAVLEAGGIEGFLLRGRGFPIG